MHWRLASAFAIRAASVGAAIVGAALVLAQPASAQTYPSKSVRLVIAFPAGGSIDTLGRILAAKLTEHWGQNVVVENRPGAGGNIGAAAAAQAAPDGYTLHLGAQTLAVNVTIAPLSGLRSGARPRADHAGRDRAGRADGGAELALPDGQDLIDDAKARPDQLNYRLARPGLERASRDRAVRAGRRHQAPARALSDRHVAGGDRHHDRAHLAVARDARRRARQCAGRQGARARGVGPRARGSAAGRADLQGAGRGDGGGIDLVRRSSLPRAPPREIVAKVNPTWRASWRCPTSRRAA